MNFLDPTSITAVNLNRDWMHVICAFKWQFMANFHQNLSSCTPPNLPLWVSANTERHFLYTLNIAINSLLCNVLLSLAQNQLFSTFPVECANLCLHDRTIFWISQLEKQNPPAPSYTHPHRHPPVVPSPQPQPQPQPQQHQATEEKSKSQTTIAEIGEQSSAKLSSCESKEKERKLAPQQQQPTRNVWNQRKSPRLFQPTQSSTPTQGVVTKTKNPKPTPTTKVTQSQAVLKDEKIHEKQQQQQQQKQPQLNPVSPPPEATVEIISGDVVVLLKPNAVTGWSHDNSQSTTTRHHHQQPKSKLKKVQLPKVSKITKKDNFYEAVKEGLVVISKAKSPEAKVEKEKGDDDDMPCLIFSGGDSKNTPGAVEEEAAGAAVYDRENPWKEQKQQAVNNWAVTLSYTERFDIKTMIALIEGVTLLGIPLAEHEILDGGRKKFHQYLKKSRDVTVNSTFNTELLKKESEKKETEFKNVSQPSDTTTNTAVLESSPTTLLLLLAFLAEYLDRWYFILPLTLFDIQRNLAYFFSHEVTKFNPLSVLVCQEVIELFRQTSLIFDLIRLTLTIMQTEVVTQQPQQQQLLLPPLNFTTMEYWMRILKLGLDVRVTPRSWTLFANEVWPRYLKRVGLQLMLARNSAQAITAHFRAFEASSTVTVTNRLLFADEKEHKMYNYQRSAIWQMEKTFDFWIGFCLSLGKFLKTPLVQYMFRDLEKIERAENISLETEKAAQLNERLAKGETKIEEHDLFAPLYLLFAPATLKVIPFGCLKTIRPQEEEKFGKGKGNEQLLLTTQCKKCIQIEVRERLKTMPLHSVNKIPFIGDLSSICPTTVCNLTRCVQRFVVNLGHTYYSIHHCTLHASVKNASRKLIGLLSEDDEIEIVNSPKSRLD